MGKESEVSLPLHTYQRSYNATCASLLVNTIVIVNEHIYYHIVASHYYAKKNTQMINMNNRW